MKDKNGYYLRMSLRELEKEEHKDERYNFLKAWKAIKELDPDNPNSFWAIASYHGEPFKKRVVEPKELTTEWRGYCQHQNVLFPTWHRFYVWRLEKALQTVHPDVSMHYWDQTSKESLDQGLPNLLTDEKVKIDDAGTEIDNPLLNFQLPCEIKATDDKYYGKEKGYVTKRFPYSGIDTPVESKRVAKGWNDFIDKNVKDKIDYLNFNVKKALVMTDYSKGPSIETLYKDCLSQGNYNPFSNTSSARKYKENLALEAPHNQIHLAVGGYTFHKDGTPAKGANGDMGENDTAAFDPCFFFHHCNVDRMFWVWQKKWYKTTKFTIDDNKKDLGVIPGSQYGQGPTPNQKPDQQLNMDTILYPFQTALGVPVSSKDCIDIEHQLKYTYTIGSLDKDAWQPPVTPSIKKFTSQTYEETRSIIKSTMEKEAAQHFINITKMPDKDKHASCAMVAADNDTNDVTKLLLKIENIPLNKYQGSLLFILRVKKNGEEIGRKGVLNRWARENCSNCMRNNKTMISFNLQLTQFLPLEELKLSVVTKNPNHEAAEKTVQLQTEDKSEIYCRYVLAVSKGC